MNIIYKIDVILYSSVVLLFWIVAGTIAGLFIGLITLVEILIYAFDYLFEPEDE